MPLPVPFAMSSQLWRVAPVLASTIVCSLLGVWSARTPVVSTSVVELCTDELVAFASRPGVRAVDEVAQVGDEVAQVGDEVGPDDFVAFALFGVVADHEPLGSGAVVAVAF